MNKLIKNKQYIICLSVLTVSFIGCFIWYFYVNGKSKHITDRFTKQTESLYKQIEEKGERFCFVKDSLVYWSDNTITFNGKQRGIMSVRHNKDMIIELKDGVYLHKSSQQKDTTTHWLYLIKHKYDHTNKYLNNSFNSPFDLDEEIDIVSYQTDFPVIYNDELICYLEASPECLELSTKDMFVLKLWTAFNVFFLLLFAIGFLRIRPKKRLYRVLITSCLMLIFALCTFLLYNHTDNISFKLFDRTVNYNSLLLFIVVTLLGFIVYKLCDKILHYDNSGKYVLLHKFLIIALISAIGGMIMKYCEFEQTHRLIETKAQTIVRELDNNNAKVFYILMNAAVKDTTVENHISKHDLIKAEQYIDKYYLNLLKETNLTSLVIFEQKDSMIVAPWNKYVSILSYVDNRIKSSEKIDTLENVYVEGKNEDINTYLYYKKLNDVYVFAECLKKEKSKNMNYSLLLDDQTDDDRDLSFAKYINGNFVYSKGERIFEDRIQHLQSGWLQEKNYETYYINKANITYVVSSPTLYIYNIISTVSIFFLLLTFMFGIDRFLTSGNFLNKRTLNIKSSILLSLLGSFIISLLLLGFFGARSIRNLNIRNNTDILQEKTSTIRLEIAKISEVNGEITENDLIQLSNTFLTDINLFNEEGNLVSTSQYEIFNKGILSNKINSDAYKKLKNGGTNIFYQKEKICDGEFLASYCPIEVNNGDEVLYLNIPFINQQKIMNDNINDLINNFANMFLFWVNVAVVIFILLSNLITKPLEIIKEKLSKVNIEAHNDKIIWDKDDEMGDLVKSYNMMIDKIEQSSILLKQQERQSSWRELAKQVAHDIKNPLTPMKLSIQYLQKLYVQKPELFDVKWREISPSLISQIETISNITQELNFYSHPSVKREKIDLNECMINAINLFANIDTVQINYTPQPQCFTLGEEKLFIRIFNNLIKNSMQALYDRNDGVIDINIRKNDGKYVVSFADNGCGIKQEDQSKIFNTHFTTKADGGGIGLTIVKSILENYQATIDFKSKENVGTVFFIKFNAI